LFVDCSGLQKVDSTRGNKYWLAITDDWSRYTWIFFVKSVSEATDVVEDFLRATLKHTKINHKVEHIRVDGGPDFKAAKFNEMCRKRAIEVEPTNADSSEQNGVAERVNGIIAERVRTVLQWANLPLAWWEEAARYCVQLRNVTPTQANTGGMSPFRKRNGRDHDLNMFQPFGSLAGIYLKPMKRKGKLRKAAQVGILLGFGEKPGNGGYQGYRVYNWETGKTVTRYDVDFNPELPAMEYITRLVSTSPDAQFLNRTITKSFDSELHKGVVSNLFKDKHGETLFNVVYEDGDSEDLHFGELIQHLDLPHEEAISRLRRLRPELVHADAAVTGRPTTTEARAKVGRTGTLKYASARRQVRTTVRARGVLALR
jgi:IS30 family transposase